MISLHRQECVSFGAQDIFSSAQEQWVSLAELQPRCDGEISGLPMARQMASFHHVLGVLSHPLNVLTFFYFQPNMIEVAVKIVDFLQVCENIQVGKRNL